MIPDEDDIDGPQPGEWQTGVIAQLTDKPAPAKRKRGPKVRIGIQPPERAYKRKNED